MAENELRRRSVGLTETVIQTAAVTWQLGKILLLTGFGLTIFLIGFLGYFTFPFVILASIVIAFGIRGLYSALRKFLARARI